MICVVRHGQTDWNVQGRIQGHADIPLNENGRMQARILRDRLSDIAFDLVFASPLCRAVETAKIISGKKEILTDVRLIERCNGKLEGLTGEEIRRVREMPDYDPERLGVESNAQVQARTVSFLDELRARYPGKNILIVTHGGVSVFVRCYFEGEPADGNYGGLMLGNCAYRLYEK